MSKQSSRNVTHLSLVPTDFKQKREEVRITVFFPPKEKANGKRLLCAIISACNERLMGANRSTEWDWSEWAWSEKLEKRLLLRIGILITVSSYRPDRTAIPKKNYGFKCYFQNQIFRGSPTARDFVVGVVNCDQRRSGGHYASERWGKCSNGLTFRLQEGRKT